MIWRKAGCDTGDGYFSPPRLLAPHTRLTTNDEILIIPTLNDPIIFNNDTVMEITQPAIDTLVSLYN